jgi:hypothetical protein
MRRWGLVVPFAVLLAAGLALAGALVLDVDDGEPEQLDGGVVGREVAAGLGDLAELVVQRLDRCWSCRAASAPAVRRRGRA